MNVTDIMVITWILGANNHIHYARIVVRDSIQRLCPEMQKI